MGPAKTGWTEAARHTYAASVTRNGHELLLTMLDSPNKWVDSQVLFNWGFAQVEGQGDSSSTPSP
jgi:D-alanyl-D-alanine carboxypeptidase (penicillin-binding protein 5/6)